MKQIKGNVLITGGAGTLGTAIIERAQSEHWDCKFTVLSRDPVKHQQQAKIYSGVHYLLGDICDLNGLSKAFAGHDIVIHAAAMKHIPEAELNVRDGIRVNVLGSENVAKAAIASGVSKVVGISTDKVCHPVNVYGASKMMMERLFQEYDRMNLTQFHLVRYGNVLNSTGSVLKVWNEMLKKDGYVTATDPDMSRFWMTTNEAIDLILESLESPSGVITIPFARALNMGKFFEYTMPAGTRVKYNGLRPGEKRFEQLITPQEYPFCDTQHSLKVHNLYPVSGSPIKDINTYVSPVEGLTSNNVAQLTREQLLEMLR